MVWYCALCYVLAVFKKGQVVVAEAVTWSSLCFALGSVAEAITWSSTVPCVTHGTVLDHVNASAVCNQVVLAEAVTWC